MGNGNGHSRVGEPTRICATKCRSCGATLPSVGSRATLEDRVLDLLDQLVTLPRDVRMNLVSAVEAAARVENLEHHLHPATR